MKNKGEILAAVLSQYGNCYFFLHNTKDKTIADKIMAEGFIYENQIPHSTDRVNPNEPIEVTYFLFLRKDYGAYTMIIAIPKKVYENYTRRSIDMDTTIEEIISIADPFYGDNDELMYTLPPEHILGYYNNISGEFQKNKKWDPDFDISASKQLERKTPARRRGC